MKAVFIAFLVACAVGSSMAQDCSAKFKEFRDCHKKAADSAKAALKTKFDAMKPKMDACYTDNGCTPPAKPQKGASSGGSSGGASGAASGERHGNNTAGRECRKALHEASKKNFQDCITKAVPGFTLPQHDEEHDEKHHFGGHHGGFNHKDENKKLDGCAKKEAVRDCKRALFNSSRPTEDDKQAHFKANCDTKQTCLTALGADCQAQLEKFKKAACQCRQQQFQQIAQLRASVSACSGVPDNKGKGKKPEGKGQRQPKSCDDTPKDYCKLGYAAFVQDHPHHEGKKGQ